MIAAGTGLELAGAVWVGVLFLFVACFFAADLFTLFGFLFHSCLPNIRTSAALAAMLLSLIALVQGSRDPVVRTEEVVLRGLPKELDGKTAVQLTDVHLCPFTRFSGAERLINQVNGLRPDILFMTGDIFDDLGTAARFLPVLKRLSAPLGVWAVTGNHEFYAGLEESKEFYTEAGFHTLTEGRAEAAPGLWIAGVDDLTTLRRRTGDGAETVDKALDSPPIGAEIFLSHSPLFVKEAAKRGAGLVVSGHTHAGQIWPFGYVVRLFYPYLAGRYSVGGTTLIVSRGTGTWGPPMRLFRRSEIVRIVLRRG
jgi:predicted MPP superfamily phosphohydrolase